MSGLMYRDCHFGLTSSSLQINVLYFNGRLLLVMRQYKKTFVTKIQRFKNTQMLAKPMNVRNLEPWLHHYK